MLGTSRTVQHDQGIYCNEKQYEAKKSTKVNAKAKSTQ